MARCFQELALASNRRLKKLVPEDSCRQECHDPKLGYPSHCSVPGVIFGRDPKNEDLLIAACHFWSNGVNTFLFGHGPMSPTLADVYMITGLDITGSVQP
jgi:hypothetical protein